MQEGAKSSVTRSETISVSNWGAEEFCTKAPASYAPM